MILHRYIVKVDGREINLRPFGDLQKGAPGFRGDLWNRWKSDALKDKGSLLIGMGDYEDAFRPTIEKKLQSALQGDPSAYIQMENKLLRSVQEFAEELAPFKHRIIGLHCGHHHFNLQSNICSCQYLCQLLGVKHLGFVAMTELVLRGPSSNSVIIFSTHGCGGASYIHSDLSKLERNILPDWEADVYLRGHSTKAYAFAKAKYGMTKNRGQNAPKLLKRVKWLVNTGGFLEGYQEGMTSYVEEKNMSPALLGWCVVNFKLSNGGEDPLQTNAYQVVG